MTGKLCVFFIPVIFVALLLAACAPAATPAPPLTSAPTKPSAPVLTQPPASAPMQPPSPAPTPTPQVVTYTQRTDDSLTLTVILPWQGAQRQIRELDFTPPVSDTKRDHCTLIRPIINIEVYDAEGKIIPTFSPTMTLVVQYGQEDLQAVDNDPTKLILGFYDVQKEMWEPIPGETDIQPVDKTSGTVTVQVAEWGDRHLCFCPKPK